MNKYKRVFWRCCHVGVEELGGECFWAVSQSHLLYKTLLLCCKTASSELFSPGPEYQYLWKGQLGEYLRRILKQLELLE